MNYRPPALRLALLHILLMVGIAECSPAQVAKAQISIPQALDSRLVVELVAQEPDIVTPTGIAVDRQGRIFVAESHTHFRPDGYDGPQADRILMFEDLDGNGKIDRRTVFHEGFVHIMDIEFSPDGVLYVATRMNIHALRDLDGDRRAELVEPIVRMETEGNYPHNGLSGLAFDVRGGFHFGLGENLGKPYVLVGRDGKRISGGGEGGSTYHVRVDGTELKRTSTGWWNPFGMCVDAFGRVFGTDNDPDASPPCRLIQVVSGGDYGYEFRYGRTGLHPLTTWNGTLPGTLPMISGTGEAPCAVISYDADGLPAEYRGQLLVASWADHRVERYPLEYRDSEGLVTTHREIFVEGADSFRPVGLATAPEGSVYVSDWVSSSYTLHKLGRIWRIRPLAVTPNSGSGKGNADSASFESLKTKLLSADRWTRELAASRLSKTDEGVDVLKRALTDSADANVQATIIQVLAGRPDLDWLAIARHSNSPSLHTLVVHSAPKPYRQFARLMETKQPAHLLAEIFPKLDGRADRNLLINAWSDTDPLVRNSIAIAVANTPELAIRELVELSKSHPLLAILAWHRNETLRSAITDEQLQAFTQSSDPQVRLVAVKWIADDRRESLRGRLQELLSRSDLDVPMFLSIVAALDRVDGRPPVDRPANGLLRERLVNIATPLTIRVAALRLIDPLFAELKVADLKPLLGDDSSLALEAIRTLAAHPSNERLPLLMEIARSDRRGESWRCAAICGLAPVAEMYRDDLLELVASRSLAIQREAFRALVGVKLNETEMARIRQQAGRESSVDEALLRLTTGKPESRPGPTDLANWERLAAIPGDRQSGERIFFGAKLGTCSRCHQFEGRGSAVGPDLSRIWERVAGETNQRRWLLDTILSPGKQMAPHFTPWVIELKDGRTLTGLPRRKGGNAEAYLGADGKEFTIKKDQIESHRESKVSIMPQDLLNSLTRQEVSDLLEFLTAARK